MKTTATTWFSKDGNSTYVMLRGEKVLASRAGLGARWELWGNERQAHLALLPKEEQREAVAHLPND